MKTSPGARASTFSAFAPTIVPRLRLLAGMYAIATTAVMIAIRLEHASMLRLPAEMPRDTTALAISLAGSLLLIAATFSRLPVRRVVLIGALDQLLGALAIAWFEQAPEIGRG